MLFFTTKEFFRQYDIKMCEIIKVFAQTAIVCANLKLLLYKI